MNKFKAVTIILPSLMVSNLLFNKILADNLNFSFLSWFLCTGLAIFCLKTEIFCIFILITTSIIYTFSQNFVLLIPNKIYWIKKIVTPQLTKTIGVFEQIINSKKLS